MIRVIDGFLVLSKRERGPNDGAEVLVSGKDILGVEPHRTGCYVYVAGHKWDVQHTVNEITEAVSKFTDRHPEPSSLRT